MQKISCLLDNISNAVTYGHVARNGGVATFLASQVNENKINVKSIN